MANSDKNIVITPATGTTAKPSIRLTGGNTSASVDLIVEDDASLIFKNVQTGNHILNIKSGATTASSIWSVNDISGVPSIELTTAGRVKITEFGGGVDIGTATITSPVTIYGNVSLTGRLTTNQDLYVNTNKVTTAADHSGMSVSYAATAGDSGKLDGLDSLAFVRSVLGSEGDTVPATKNLNTDMAYSYVGSVNVGTNHPDTTGWYNVINIKHRNSATGVYGGQIAFGMNTATGKMYFREHNNSIWGSWQRVVTNSGSWAISITGSAGSATGNAGSATKLQTARNIGGTSFDGSADITPDYASSVASSGARNATTNGTTRGTTGLRLYDVYSNGYPTTYGNVIHVRGSGATSGAGELLLGWSGTDGAHASNYIRSKKDNDTGAWSGWAEILTNINTGFYSQKTFNKSNAAHSTPSSTETVDKWYTIAYNVGSRAFAKFVIHDIQRHQSVVFYASHNYGNGNVINVISNSLYSIPAVKAIRIKARSTFSGAVLQVLLSYDAGWGAPNLRFAVYENEQSTGWVPVDFRLDSAAHTELKFTAAETVGGTAYALNAASYGLLVEKTIVSLTTNNLAVLPPNIHTITNSAPDGTTGAVTTTQHTIWHAGNDGSGSGLDADTVDGLHIHTDRNNEADKIVRTQGNGYIHCGYINSSNGNEKNNSSPPYVWGTNGTDDYLRTYDPYFLTTKGASKAAPSVITNKALGNGAGSYGVGKILQISSSTSFTPAGMAYTPDGQNTFAISSTNLYLRDTEMGWSVVDLDKKNINFRKIDSNYKKAFFVGNDSSNYYIGQSRDGCVWDTTVVSGVQVSIVGTHKDSDKVYCFGIHSSSAYIYGVYSNNNGISWSYVNTGFVGAPLSVVVANDGNVCMLVNDSGNLYSYYFTSDLTYRTRINHGLFLSNELCHFQNRFYVSRGYSTGGANYASIISSTDSTGNGMSTVATFSELVTDFVITGFGWAFISTIGASTSMKFAGTSNLSVWTTFQYGMTSSVSCSRGNSVFLADHTNVILIDNNFSYYEDPETGVPMLAGFTAYNGIGATVRQWVDPVNTVPTSRLVPTVSSAANTKILVNNGSTTTAQSWQASNAIIGTSNSSIVTASGLLGTTPAAWNAFTTSTASHTSYIVPGLRIKGSWTNGVMSSASFTVGIKDETNGEAKGILSFVATGTTIGTPTHSWLFYRDGSFESPGDIIAFSDKKFKTDIKKIPDALNKVLRINGYSFLRIDEEGNQKKDRRYTGVLAQEVQSVLPEAVYENANGLGVAYGNLVGLLIEAIKELKAEVDLLKGKK